MKSFKQFVVETKSICNKTKKGKYCPSHGTNDCNIEESSKEVDHEYSMARSELSTISNAAKRLRKKMKGEGDIKAWVQSKITKAADYIDTAADYVDSQEIGEACWKGYKKKGMKKMFGKKYPNCVKVEETKSGDQGLLDWFGKSESKDKKPGWGNSTKNEETNIDENYLRIQTRGSTYTILINWRGKYITNQMFFQKFTRPTKTEVTREIQKVYPNAIVLAFNPSANDPTKPLLFTGEPNGPKSY